MNRPAWIGLAGPTASGKSAIALALAQRLPLEIVSVDSALVYRGMDIGSAKPSVAEQAAVPHHLIDLIDPRETYSAAQFAADATRLIGEINARGRLPLLVGGTMLYFKILSDGIDALPAVDPALRAAIEAEAFARGWTALHAELARVDPVSAARLPATDAQRIGRALEVFRSSGRTLSSFHTAPRAPQPAALIALEPVARAWLHQRIEARFDAMLAQGLLDEVRALRARRDLHAGLPSMRCVGYRQAWTALDEGLAGEALHAAVRERGIAATRQLAKRQLTWLRGMQREIVACDGDGVLASVAAIVERWRAA
ncbi:MAG: tRNA (adenosine(37)-N6)-dimethylallyltransferase MiaA [Pseudomonadota bacterium]